MEQINIIKQLRQQINLSQSQMAKLLGVSIKKYRNIEQGKQPIPQVWLDQYCEILDFFITASTYHSIYSHN